MMRAIWMLMAAYFAVGGLFTAARADEGWVTHSHGQSRFVLEQANGQKQRGLIQHRLDKGWKTYWRFAGDAGFSLELSVDGADAEIIWPVPEVQRDEVGLRSYVYDAPKISLPVMLTWEGDERPEAVQAVFMICKVICVPIEANLPLFDKDDISAEIDKILTQVPARSDAAFSIAAPKWHKQGEEYFALFELVPASIPADTRPPEFFIEWPSGYRVDDALVTWLDDRWMVRMPVSYQLGEMKKPEYLNVTVRHAGKMGEYVIEL